MVASYEKTGGNKAEFAQREKGVLYPVAIGAQGISGKYYQVGAYFFCFFEQVRAFSAKAGAVQVRKAEQPQGLVYIRKNAVMSNL